MSLDAEFVDHVLTHWVDGHLDESSIKKSSEISIKFREEGNKLYLSEHDDDSHMQVLSLYSKSIAFAPENSEELALGLGNRSALLLHIQKFEECIHDIDKALSISKSDKFKTKLLSRKTSCLKSLNEFQSNPEKTLELRKCAGLGENVQKKLEIPKIKLSAKVPCLAENSSLKYSEKYGRHYVANKYIRPGEIVAIEEAYIAFPIPEKLYVVCSHCLSQTWNGIACSFCTMSIYCSENCKNIAWKEYHEIECSIVPNIPKPKMQGSNMQYAGLRFFIKLMKTHGFESIIKEIRESGDSKIFNDSFSCKQFQCCYSMTYEDTNPMRFLLYDKFVSKSIHLLSKCDSIFTNKVKSMFDSADNMLSFARDLLFRCINIALVNSYVFQSTECKCQGELEKMCCGVNCASRGLILTPCCSLFNHSCIPNVDRVFAENKKIIIIATQPIKKDEQLFINYLDGFVDLTKQISMRQKTLEYKYHFTCECQACSDNWPVLDGIYELPNHSPEIQKYIGEEYAKFCSKKGLKPKLDYVDEWPRNKTSMSHAIKFIELLHKKLDPFDAVVDSMVYKKFIVNTFFQVYGLG